VEGERRRVSRIDWRAWLLILIVSVVVLVTVSVLNRVIPWG
jgi:hypothetical protein